MGQWGKRRHKIIWKRTETQRVIFVMWAFQSCFSIYTVYNWTVVYSVLILALPHHKDCQFCFCYLLSRKKNPIYTLVSNIIPTKILSASETTHRAEPCISNFSKSDYKSRGDFLLSYSSSAYFKTQNRAVVISASLPISAMSWEGRKNLAWQHTWEWRNSACQIQVAGKGIVPRAKFTRETGSSIMVS